MSQTISHLPLSYRQKITHRLLMMLTQFMPAALVAPDNPVFVLETRRLSDDLALKKAMIRRAFVVLGYGLGIWAILAILMIVIPSNADRIYEFLSRLWMIAIGLSLADKLLLDFVAVGASLTRISDDFKTPQWALYSLSNRSINDYVYAKLATTEIMVWRLMTTVIVFRLLLVLLFPLHFVLLPRIMPTQVLLNTMDTVGIPAFSQTFGSILHFVLFSITMMVVALVYVLEPRWRLRALIALGLNVSARGSDASIALLASLWIIGRVWLAQIVMAITAIALIWFTIWLNALVIVALNSVLMSSVILLIYVLLIASFIRSSYDVISQRVLRRTVKRLLTRAD